MLGRLFERSCFAPPSIAMRARMPAAALAAIGSALLLAAPARAQVDPAVERDRAADGAADERSTADAASEAEVAAERAPSAANDAPASAPARPKIAIVVGGDPDPALRAAAARVEAAIGERLEQPFDPGLRAALRGEPGASDDGLEEVRRQRARLGIDESRDAEALAVLGRRAGARAVALIRAGDDGPELHVLDVRRAAFFEEALALDPSVADRTIAAFVARRARAAQRAVATPREAARAATPTTPNGETPTPSRDQPDFFEQFWPYLVAAVLLGTMVAVIVATSTGDSSDQPVLRFVPGR